MLALNKSRAFSLFGLSFHKLPQRFQFYLSNWSCLCKVCPCLYASSFLLPLWQCALTLLSFCPDPWCLFLFIFNFCYSVLPLPSHVCILYSSVACTLTFLLLVHVRTIHDETSLLPNRHSPPNPLCPELEWNCVMYLLRFYKNIFVFPNMILKGPFQSKTCSKIADIIIWMQMFFITIVYYISTTNLEILSCLFLTLWNTLSRVEQRIVWVPFLKFF